MISSFLLRPSEPEPSRITQTKSAGPAVACRDLLAFAGNERIAPAGHAVVAIFLRKQQKDPNREERRSGSLAPGHLVPPRSWGGGVDGACKTPCYPIR